MRHIGSKTFYFNGSMWVDTAWKPDQKRVKHTIKYLSNEYFQLLQRDPALGKYLALGENLLLCWGDLAYEITSATP